MDLPSWNSRHGDPRFPVRSGGAEPQFEGIGKPDRAVGRRHHDAAGRKMRLHERAQPLLRSGIERRRRLVQQPNRPPLELVIATKALAHWVTTGLPLVVASPILGLFLNLEPAALASTALTLLVGTPALTFIGAIGAALATALRRGGLLLPVLVLPLTIPVLIFGVAATDAAVAGPMPFETPFTILCALTLMSAVIGPFAAAATLRHGME